MDRRPGWLVVIPTGITLGNALCGFAAIAAITDARVTLQTEWAVWLAGWLILGAWFCDMTDGMAARLTGTTGKFGAALDSLCDVVGFGIAPAFVVATMLIANGWNHLVAWSLGAIVLVGVLVRLARFDAEDVVVGDTEGHLWFRGLPSPVVGTVIATLAIVWGAARAPSVTPVSVLGLWAPEVAASLLDVLAGAIAVILPVVAVAVALLAVSAFRYADLPKHYMRRLVPRWHLLLLLVLAIAADPGLALLVFFGLYTLLGPLVWRKSREPVLTDSKAVLIPESQS